MSSVTIFEILLNFLVFFIIWSTVMNIWLDCFILLQGLLQSSGSRLRCNRGEHQIKLPKTCTSQLPISSLFAYLIVVTFLLYTYIHCNCKPLLEWNLHLLTFYEHVQKWHPDKHKDDNAVTAKFQEINEAYTGILMWMIWSMTCQFGFLAMVLLDRKTNILSFSYVYFPNHGIAYKGRLERRHSNYLWHVYLKLFKHSNCQLLLDDV